MRHGRGRGRIKRKMPNMVAAGNVIAARVSAMVAPDNANDVFSRLKYAVGDRFNSHRQMPASLSYRSTKDFAEDMSTALKNQLSSETRDEMAMRTGFGLPSLAYRAKVGAGTAAQLKPRIGDQQQQQEFREYQTYGSSGNQQQQTSDPAMVDDAGWSKTLAQTVGSGMLSAAQLKAASYANVEAMIGHRTAGFNGATSMQLSANEKKEMTFMLQRMILEGYVRGVDIPAMIKNMNNGQIKLSNSNGSGLGLGVAGYNIGAMFDKDWWSKASDIDKIGLFYQEIGHALGVAAHTRGLMEGDDTIFSADATAKANYAKYLDYYFQDIKSESKYDITSSSADRISSADAQALLIKNPDWLPSLSGAAIPSTSTPATGETPAVQTASQAVNNITSVSNTINPSSITMTQQQQMQPSQAKGAMQQATSPVMPGGLDASVITPTKVFAAGMADISKPNDANIMENAGALLHSG